jgi:tRNA splicing endonuclease
MQEFKAVYNGRSILVPAQGEADSLQQDGFGYSKQKGQVELDHCEALYLLEKERLVIIDEGERRLLSFQEVLNRFDLPYDYKDQSQLEKEIPPEYEMIKDYLQKIGVTK